MRPRWWRGTPARAAALLATTTLAFLVLLTATGMTVAASEQPRRSDLLPGLAEHEELIDQDVAWASDALQTLTRTRESVVVVANAEHPGWPPLTGFVVGPNHVVTAHPAPQPPPGEPGHPYLVRTIDGEPQPAEQVAGWPDWDVALLEVAAPLAVEPLPIGDEGTLATGDPVLLIGHPSIQARSGAWVTTVGTFDRAVQGMLHGRLSTSAGGSGSPILDLEGNVVGMSSMGFDLGPTGNALDALEVSELRLRAAIPVHLEGTAGGVGGARLAALLAEVLP